MSVTQSTSAANGAPPGLAGKLAAYFIHSKLTVIIVLASMLLGLFAVWRLPREEEPQIQVPMIDVLAALPGGSPEEVENLVTRPLEKLLWEIPGVEYLYSTSSPRSCGSISDLRRILKNFLRA
jgi:multidrug efflux pump subunit AcrB